MSDLAKRNSVYERLENQRIEIERERAQTDAPSPPGRKPIYCPHRPVKIECETPNACAGGADCRLGPNPLAAARAIAYCELHGIRYSLTAEEGARAMNRCSWSVRGFCQPDCTCARYYRQMMAPTEADQAP